VDGRLAAGPFEVELLAGPRPQRNRVDDNETSIVVCQAILQVGNRVTRIAGILDDGRPVGNTVVRQHTGRRHGQRGVLDRAVTVIRRDRSRTEMLDNAKENQQDEQTSNSVHFYAPFLK